MAEERVRIPDIGKIREEWWIRAGKEMEGRLEKTSRAAADKDARDRLEALQVMVMSAAKGALEAQESADAGRKEGAPTGAELRGGRRTGKRGRKAGRGVKDSMIEGKVATLRANVRKWRMMAVAAGGYDGGAGGYDGGGPKSGNQKCEATF